MKIGFVVNDIENESPRYTTSALAWEAGRRGHEICYVPVEAFVLGVDCRLAARALRPHKKFSDGQEGLLESLRAAEPERLPLDELDVLMLRNDPAEDVQARPWAHLAGVDFARFAVEAGVMVLNDPDGLVRNVNKLALEHLPPQVRPRSLVSRDMAEIQRFADEQEGPVVIKPLAGSGGRNVFLVREEDRPNLKQMVRAILSEGYVLAQEALPEAADGDLRLIMMNGNILEVDGKAALMRRRPARGEFLSNVRQGAVPEGLAMTEAIREIAARVRPRIVADGLFLVGLDIAGSSLLEINVFSPGGLSRMSQLHGVDFPAAVIDDIERKVSYERPAEGCTNAMLNTL